MRYARLKQKAEALADGLLKYNHPDIPKDRAGLVRTLMKDIEIERVRPKEPTLPEQERMMAHLMVTKKCSIGQLKVTNNRAYKLHVWLALSEIFSAENIRQ